MTSLITLLIALLGYGTPAEYSNHTVDELQTEILSIDPNADQDPDWWDTPGVQEEEGEE